MKKFSTGLLAGMLIVSIPSVFALTKASFKDVPQGIWYESAVNDLQNIGVIKGFSDNTFQPNRNISRAEAAIMFENFKNYADKTYGKAVKESTVNTWKKYTSVEYPLLDGVEYPSNFYLNENNENGEKLLSIQSAAGIMLLPGEGTDCAYDKCNPVDGGLIITIGSIKPSDEATFEVTKDQREKTAYTDIEKIKDVTKVQSTMRDPKNVKEIYNFERSQNLYRIEVYANNFSGNSRPIIDKILQSLANSSERKFGYIKKTYQSNGQEYIDAEIYSDTGIYTDSMEKTGMLTLQIEPNVVVKLSNAANRANQETITYQDFKKIMNGENKTKDYLKTAAYYFELKNNHIIKITQKFST